MKTTNMRKKQCFFIIFLFFNTFATASPCDLAAFQQFNFWLGEWQVKPYGSDEHTTAVGQSKISKINNGCTVLEEYQTPNGYEGKSLNIYDVTRHVWHQTWTDNTGLLLQLEGTLVDGKMILIGNTLTAEQVNLAHKITWAPITNKGANKTQTVRQIWQTSNDNGVTWTTVFDGEYFPVGQ